MINRKLYKDNFVFSVISVLVEDMLFHGSERVPQQKVIEELGISKQLFNQHMKLKADTLAELGVEVIKEGRFNYIAISPNNLHKLLVAKLG